MNGIYSIYKMYIYKRMENDSNVGRQANFHIVENVKVLTRKTWSYVNWKSGSNRTVTLLFRMRLNPLRA